MVMWAMRKNIVIWALVYASTSIVYHLGPAKITGSQWMMKVKERIPFIKSMDHLPTVTGF